MLSAAYLGVRGKKGMNKLRFLSAISVLMWFPPVQAEEGKLSGPNQEKCLKEYEKGGVMKGKMTRHVNSDGTLKYVFIEDFPCSKQKEETGGSSDEGS